MVGESFLKDGNHRNIWLLQISVVLHPYIVTKLIPFSLVQSYVPYNMVLQTQNVLPSYMFMTLRYFKFFQFILIFPDVSRHIYMIQNDTLWVYWVL